MRAMNADVDVVVLHPRGGIEIDDRIDLDRVAEINLPALQLVLGAGEGGAAVGDADMAKQGGVGDRPPYAQIDVSGQLGKGILKVQLGRRRDMHIQSDVVRGRVRVGQRSPPRSPRTSATPGRGWG